MRVLVLPRIGLYSDCVYVYIDCVYLYATSAFRPQPKDRDTYYEYSPIPLNSRSLQAQR